MNSRIRPRAPVDLVTQPYTAVNSKLGEMVVVSEGIQTTFQFLSTTKNETALRTLVPALDSPHPTIRESALLTILGRRSSVGHREIIRRLHRLDDREKQIVQQHGDRMLVALRDAIVGTDEQMRMNACRAAIWFRQYDLMPVLTNALEDRTNQSASLVGETLIKLAEALHNELVSPSKEHPWREPKIIRNEIIEALSLSIGRFGTHQRREVLEAFLLLVPSDNSTLKQILKDPHHVAFVAVMEILSKSKHAGVMQLLLNMLDDAHAPSAAISLLAKRTDMPMVRKLLHKVGREIDATIASNLKRIESIGWLGNESVFLDELDEAAQHGAVHFITASGIPRTRAFTAIDHLLRKGKPNGRRAAAEALDAFNGANANALALYALNDSDPRVQASVLAQLRRRGIPGVLTRLVDALDSPHAAVRGAARTALPEFTFQRYLGTFDMLSDEVRHSTGILVKKVDPQCVRELRTELESNMRSRRLRGLAMVRILELIKPLEPIIIRLLEDTDHMVRVEAAMTLGQSNSEASRRALSEARKDRSQSVQEAVNSSIHRQEQLVDWLEQQNNT